MCVASVSITSELLRNDMRKKKGSKSIWIMTLSGNPKEC